MKALNAQQKKQLSERIRTVEASCNAELVTVIARQSDDYLYIPMLWSALLALMLPGCVSLLDIPLTVGEVYLLQVVVFVGAAMLLSTPAVKFRVVPKAVMHKRASRHAHELFFIEGLHLTGERSGVMIFVSENERYVEIIADHGISKHVSNSVWQDIVKEFVMDVKAGEIHQGYMKAIDGCGSLLQQHFPGAAKNSNELPDHLIEI